MPHPKHLSALAACLLLALAACGGGGSGSSSGSPPEVSVFVPGTAGGSSEAAVALPIAGSVTQSSDTLLGVTANTVDASVSLDSRGLLTAEIRGNGWAIQNEPIEGHRISPIPIFGFEYDILTYEKRYSNGSLRLVSVLSDRQLIEAQNLDQGDRWVSSSNVLYDSSDDAYSGVWDRITQGVSGTLSGVNGTLYCVDSCNYDLPDDGQVDFDTVINHNIASDSGAFGSDRHRDDYRFIPDTDAQAPPEDRDHLVLGYWAHFPAKWVNEYGEVACYEDCSPQFYKDSEFGVFVNGSDPFQQSRIPALTGTATYEGPAFAVYNDKYVGTESFMFAKATLAADFGTSENGAVSGYVQDFIHAGNGEASPPSALTLNSAPISDEHSGFFTGDTAMTFYGSSLQESGVGSSTETARQTESRVPLPALSALLQQTEARALSERSAHIETNVGCGKRQMVAKSCRPYVASVAAESRRIHAHVALTVIALLLERMAGARLRGNVASDPGRSEPKLALF